MNRFIIVLLTILFMLSGCSNNKVPDYVIPPDDMVSILVDIHLTDGMMSSHQVRREIAREDSVNIYNILLHNYGYSRHDFDTSLYYYGKNMALYDKIYEDVLNQLNEMETYLKEQEQEEVRDTTKD